MAITLLFDYTMKTFTLPELWENILAQGVALGASDIHLEPREDFLRLRYRVDGLLQEAPPLHKRDHYPLVSLIKVAAKLDIAEVRLPQDGSLARKIGKKLFDLRVAVIPTIHGEKVVIRLLDRQQSVCRLESLGMESEDLDVYRQIIAKRHGLVLVTGPTGSGKTTTLYSTLSLLNRRELNIVTIEDPVEYHLPGINQVQVNNKSGLTFARGLRSLLRHDPDIIMVGEIRDEETARITVQAALTGHLVFSTLHTNDAPSAVIRLEEMGIEKYLLNTVVLGVVAQRLVRKKEGDKFIGRTGIYQVMSGATPSAGLKTLLDNGRKKVADNLTTEEEVLRVLFFS